MLKKWDLRSLNHPGSGAGAGTVHIGSHRFTYASRNGPPGSRFRIKKIQVPFLKTPKSPIFAARLIGRGQTNTHNLLRFDSCLAQLVRASDC